MLHSKEAELLKELRRTHLAMVDAFVDKKIEVFETFYFNEYANSFRTNWEKAFQQNQGRVYDPARDFPMFSNDLVASYQQNVEPFQKLRVELRDQVATAHDQVAEAHQGVGDWIRSVEKLTKSQRTAADRLLQSINPALSVEGIETKVNSLTQKMIENLKP